jgi:O-antigen/teichoic acid export membrane protein
VRRVLARNAAWNAASYVLHAVVLLVLSPYVVESLGKDLFGVWVIINTLTGYLNVADFGIRPAIVHFVARHHARGETEEINRYVNGAFVTLALGGVLVLVATLIAAPRLGMWFDVAVERQAAAGHALLVSGIFLATFLPLNAFTAVLIGRQRFDLTCRIDLVSLLVSTAGIVLVLVLDGGIVALALVIGTVELGEMLWKSRLAFREQPTLRFAPRRASRVHVQGLLHYGGFNLVVTASLLLADKTDALVIGGVMGAAAVTLFDRAAKMPVHARTMIFQVGRVLMPELGARDARGDQAGVVRLLAKASRQVLLAAGPILVYLFVLGGAFLETWMHGDAAFRVEAGPALIVLAFAAAFPISSYPLVMAHQGTGRMRSLALISLAEGLANLALSLWWVRLHGLIGVAWGTLVPAALVHGVVLPWWNGRVHGFGWFAWALRVWTTPVLAGGATYGVLRWAFDPAGQHGWGALIAGGLLAMAVFLVVGLGTERWLARRGPPAAGRGS